MRSVPAPPTGSSSPLRRAGRMALAGALSAAALVAPACGGSSDAPPPATPGGNVDPNAKGVIGGSINKAKDTADAQEQRDKQVENGVPEP